MNHPVYCDTAYDKAFTQLWPFYDHLHIYLIVPLFSPKCASGITKSLNSAATDAILQNVENLTPDITIHVRLEFYISLVAFTV